MSGTAGGPPKTSHSECALYACERLFGEQRGREVHEMVETAIGGQCPCLRGDPCPITPSSTAVVEPVSLGMPFLAIS